MIEPCLDTRLYSLVQTHTFGQLADVGYMRSAVAHIHEHGIPGAIVECGVWRGGMLKAALLACAEVGAEREVWGYDTFTGMTETGPNDTGGTEQVGKLATPEAEVREYLGDRARLVVGDVRETLQKHRPAGIAILRLDVDWYESTYACLEALYPLLAVGGVLLIDDYDFWEGCKRAVDAYLGADSARLERTGTGSGMIK